MSGPSGGVPADQFRGVSARRWWEADGSPGFWFLASGVFAANGLFSAWQHTWWLAVMQVLTAMLALRAALSVGASNRTRDGSVSEADRGDVSVTSTGDDPPERPQSYRH